MGIAENEMCFFRWELGGKIAFLNVAEKKGVLRVKVQQNGGLCTEWGGGIIRKIVPSCAVFAPSFFTFH